MIFTASGASKLKIRTPSKKESKDPASELIACSAQSIGEAAPRRGSEAVDETARVANRRSLPAPQSPVYIIDGDLENDGSSVFDFEHPSHPKDFLITESFRRHRPIAATANREQKAEIRPNSLSLDEDGIKTAKE